MSSKVNAFEAAESTKKKSAIKKQVAVPGDKEIAEAIDDFVTYKEEENLAKTNKTRAAALFQEFALDTYVVNAIEGRQENPTLMGLEKSCMFIIKDQTTNIKQENKEAITALDINTDDVLEEVDEFSFDTEVMSTLSKKDAKQIGEFLGKYLEKYPGLLKVARTTHAKKEALYKLPMLSGSDPEKMKQLINLLQYIKFPK